MIYLDIVGRCGNQMFQYAFAKKISVINNDEQISIDFSRVYREGKNRNDNTFKNDLADFYASNSFNVAGNGENKIYKYGSKRQIFIFKIYTKIKRILKKTSKDKRLANKIMYRLMSRYGIYWYYAPEQIKNCNEKNKFIFGFFENPKFFYEIAEVLSKDFTPIHCESDKNFDMYKEIHNSNSVCVSFRKWENNEPIKDHRYVCTKEYYQNAIDYAINEIPNVKLVIFSNDVEWVKKEFNLPENSIFEEGNDTIYEKIRLMYSCKHFILSNSTFAWWAQFLGRNNNKIVLAPECWFRDDKQDDPLMLPNFKKVSIK